CARLGGIQYYGSGHYPYW
nr:immunoglobulin heavy chain junction region [Macaca mulatta]